MGCFPCIFFAKSIDVRKGKGVFIEKVFTNYKKMYQMCDFYAAREYHKDAIAVCDAFVATMSGKQESVLVQLSKGVREAIQSNRKKLRSIIETIALCGRQNISLHGHQDSGTDVEGEQAAGKNHGNFWALLKFRISAGDTTLSDHLNSAARNATYTSPDIQNQLINILGDQIRADSERGFSMLRKVNTDQRPTLKQSTIISLMAIKFNSKECCHDSIFNEELLTKCKKATVLHNTK